MKAKHFFVFVMFQLVVLSTSAQTFISQKQAITIGTKDATFLTGERKIIISGNNFEAELPDTIRLYGTLKYWKDTVEKGKKVKGYKIDGGGIIWVGFNNVFVNLYATRNKTYTFFLTNYVEPTEAENIAEKIKSDKAVEQYMYETHVKTYGEFTAKCIRENKVKPMMKEEAIFLILGQPIRLYMSDTLNKKSIQYIFCGTNVTIENGIVTAIELK